MSLQTDSAWQDFNFKASLLSICTRCTVWVCVSVCVGGVCEGGSVCVGVFVGGAVFIGEGCLWGVFGCVCICGGDRIIHSIIEWLLAFDIELNIHEMTS